MKKKAHELEFISQINRDGSGTKPVPESYLTEMLENKLMKDEYFKLTCLSLTEGTYIAVNFNSFVVKIKKQEVKKDNTAEDILVKDFEVDVADVSSTAVWELILQAMEKYAQQKSLKTELDVISKYSERIGLDAERRMEEIEKLIG